MEYKKLEKLIIKYFTRSISQKEWEDLNAWFEKNTDSKSFDEYLKINYVIDDIMSEFNTKKTKESVLKKIKQDKVKVYRIRAFKYAAAILVLLGLGYFYQKDYFKQSQNELVFPSENAITLEMDNGSLKVISEGESTEIVNSEGKVIGKQNGNRLVYNELETESEELIYNQLTVPHGKRFELQLSDGTIVHLNAGTSLKYPINFLKEGERKVFLTGEAFLDVFSDKERAFVINTNDLDVSVLGTRFNVSAYPEDNITDVVLVEGSVQLSSSLTNTDVKDVLLEPGFKGSFNREEQNITTKPVITSIYTSWMKGDLIFRNMTFENILKKLERHYDLKITNRNSEYSNKKFNANFGDEPIEKVLGYFKNTYGIDYTIVNNEVIIN